MENSNVQTFGKVREPLLAVSNLFRAFHAQNAVTRYSYGGKEIFEYESFHFHSTGYTKQEGIMSAYTVFNYFTPEDAPYSLKKIGLVAPEFTVFSSGLHQLLMGLINKDGFVYRTYKITAELQIDYEISLVEAKKYDELIDHLDVLLSAKMSDSTKSSIKDYMIAHSELSNDKLVRYVISLVITSPDYTVQR